LPCKQKVEDSSPSVGSKLMYSDSKTLEEDFDTYRTTGVLPGIAKLCPDCGCVLIHDEGCKGGRCDQCGYSSCS
jgi:hypothetical protein